MVATTIMIIAGEMGKKEHVTKEPSLKPIETGEDPKKPKPITEKSLDDEDKRKQEQSALDIEYTRQVEKFYEMYPMFGFLPIETENYRIVYSIEKNKYRIRIKKNSDEITEQEKQILINKALNDIKQAGETGKIEYYVLTKDQ